MDIFILLAQSITLLLSFLVIFMVLATLPYVIGRQIGRKEGQSFVVNRAMQDEQEFMLWLNEQKIQANRREISRLGTLPARGTILGFQFGSWVKSPFPQTKA